jgi:hypothetical protein
MVGAAYYCWAGFGTIGNAVSASFGSVTMIAVSSSENGRSWCERQGLRGERRGPRDA